MERIALALATKSKEPNPADALTVLADVLENIRRLADASAETVMALVVIAETFKRQTEVLNELLIAIQRR